jgi:hypothetical protein
MDIQTDYQFADRINNKGFILVIIVSWIIAGTLDALAATFILAKGNWAGVFKYVASAVYGKAAFTGGTGIALQGLIMHYIIALTFTAFYFFIYPYTNFLHKSVALNAVVFGAFVFVVMNLGIVPITKIGFKGMSMVSVVVNLLILIVCIALPVTYMASKYYAKPPAYKNQLQ